METRIQTNIPSKQCMENFSCIGWVSWPLPLAVPAILPYTEVYLASSDMEGGGTSIPEVIAAPPLILETWERYLSLIPFLLLPPP